MVMATGSWQLLKTKMPANKLALRLALMRPLTWVVVAALGCSHAWANPPVDAVRYTIQPGDTFNNLAQRLLTPPPDWMQLQQVNQIRNLDRISVGQVLLLPRSALRFTPSYATVMQLNCNADIVVRGQALEVGNKLNEGDVVDIPSTCSMGLALEDGSVVRVPAGGRLQINMLRTNVMEAAPVIRMQISRGRVEVSVNKGVGRTAPFEISTPTVVMGVRGTEFRVGHTDEADNSLVEVLSGQVGVAEPGAAPDKEKRVPGGRGMVVDAQGGTLADEALLPGPALEVTDTTPLHWRLKVDATPAAAKVWVRQSQLATLADMPTPKPLKELEYWIHKPETTAMFYELVGESAAGLRGEVSRYGVCASANDLCNVVLNSPFPPSMPIRIRLQRVEGGQPFAVVLSRNLRTADGLFVLTGLPAGRYQWVITQATSRGQASTAGNRLQETGEFVLINGPAARQP
jgi:hypothetical protein